jgi:uncharacterized caspase-like protein
MTSAAVIVGINDYVTQPLTSAVNDAQGFRDALVEHGLVSDDNVRLLTEPAEREEDRPTRKGILDALESFYTGEETADRLFFYYAGHGLLLYGEVGQALPRTALIPVDMRDLKKDGDVLIDFDSVLTRLRFSGPPEQFFFIDACRDFAYEEHPDTTTALGWQKVQPSTERAQAILYAVPPLGRAEGEQDGLGVMTRHLIDALGGYGLALDYSDDLREYVVSPESVAAYVKKRVFETVGTVELWKRKYILPQLDHREPKTGPIRKVDEPADTPLTVRVEPSAAEDATSVKLMQMEFAVCSWPPNAYRQAYPIRPRQYWLEAESTAGTPEPVELRLDAREEHEATILVRAPDEQVSEEPSIEPGPSWPTVTTKRLTDRDAGRCRVSADAHEPQVAIELERLDPPYTSWSANGQLAESVPPGDYRIRFRLGPDVFSEGEIKVEPDKEVVIHPTIGHSPLLREMHERGTLTLGEPTEREWQLLGATRIIREGLPDGQGGHA